MSIHLKLIMFSGLAATLFLQTFFVPAPASAAIKKKIGKCDVLREDRHEDDDLVKVTFRNECEVRKGVRVAPGSMVIYHSNDLMAGRPPYHIEKLGRDAEVLPGVWARSGKSVSWNYGESGLGEIEFIEELAKDSPLGCGMKGQKGTSVTYYPDRHPYQLTLAADLGSEGGSRVPKGGKVYFIKKEWNLKTYDMLAWSTDEEIVGWKCAAPSQPGSTSHLSGF